MVIVRAFEVPRRRGLRSVAPACVARALTPHVVTPCSAAVQLSIELELFARRTKAIAFSHDELQFPHAVWELSQAYERKIERVSRKLGLLQLEKRTERLLRRQSKLD
jgi:hypothetical protein